MSQRDITGKKPICHVAHLRNLILGEFMGPSLRIISIVLTLPNGRAGDFRWEFRVRFELVVQGRMLARGFDAAVLDDGRLLGFLGRRIGLAVDRVSRVVRRKRGCQTRGHGNGPGS